MNRRASIDGLVEGTLASGLYHVRAGSSLGGEVTEALHRRGVRHVGIDLSSVAEKRRLLDLLASGLGFPDWFGHNLDALADCLSDVSRPIVVELRGCGAVAAAQPATWSSVCEVFAEAAAVTDTGGPFIVVVFGGPKPRTARPLGR